MKRTIPGLNEQESRAWKGLTGVFQLLPTALDAQLRRESELTHFEYVVLSALRYAPDATMQMSRLAEVTASTLTRLSHVCSRLEKRGFVERFVCPDNRRATNVRLASEGWDELRRATAGHIDTVRALVIDALTPEQLDQLTEITTAVLTRLHTESGTGPLFTADQDPS